MKRAFSFMALLSVMLTVLIMGQSGLAQAKTATNLALLGVDEDLFWNYDFQSPNPPQATNVDWPVDLVFTNNAHVVNIKSNYYWGENTFASEMWGYVNETGQSSDWVWDVDKGTKQGTCETAKHMRLYADADFRLYNISWGYWVAGTAHIDLNDCFPWNNARYGWNENGEWEMLNHASSQGLTTRSEQFYLWNAESARWDGNNYWDNSGRAGEVVIP